MKRLRASLLIVALPIVVAVAGLAWANRFAEIAPVDPPSPASFESALVRKGESLASIGACAVCHTSSTGEPFAGGRALPTPFGTIYTTNITPDVRTGIGAWSESAFLRAMHEGIDRSGSHLYPAFPYDHFTRVTEEDVHAIYAFLMTLEPVTTAQPENELPFPFNIRMLLAGWNLLFLERGEFEPDAARDEEWNRGAYLTEGLGHCGACHSPRNVFGAVMRKDQFGGGEAEEWHAPALNSESQSPIPWNQLQLVNYLFDGWDKHHGIVAGPMVPVVNHLYDQSEDDVFAIAAYLESWQRSPLSDAELESVLARAQELEWGEGREFMPKKMPVAPSVLRGLEVFRDQCARCHKRGSSATQPVPLALTSTVNSPDPRNIIHIIFDGIRPPPGAIQRSMPSFGASITDADIEDLVNFVRWNFTARPLWRDIREHVDKKRADW